MKSIFTYLRRLVYLTKEEKLFKYAESGDVAQIQKLIESGIEVDAKNSLGQRALERAAHNGNFEVLELLLHNGADVNAQCIKGATALISSTNMGHTDIVTRLIEARANLDLETRNGWTALSVSAYHGYKDAVEALLVGGAKVGARNELGENALKCAINQGHTEVADMIRAHKLFACRAHAIETDQKIHSFIRKFVLGKRGAEDGAIFESPISMEVVREEFVCLLPKFPATFHKATNLGSDATYDITRYRFYNLSEAASLIRKNIVIDPIDRKEIPLDKIIIVKLSEAERVCLSASKITPENQRYFDIIAELQAQEDRAEGLIEIPLDEDDDSEDRSVTGAQDERAEMLPKEDAELLPLISQCCAKFYSFFG